MWTVCPGASKRLQPPQRSHVAAPRGCGLEPGMQPVLSLGKRRSACAKRCSQPSRYSHCVETTLASLLCGKLKQRGGEHSQWEGESGFKPRTQNPTCTVLAARSSDSASIPGRLLPRWSYRRVVARWIGVLWVHSVMSGRKGLLDPFLSLADSPSSQLSPAIVPLQYSLGLDPKPTTTWAIRFYYLFYLRVKILPGCEYSNVSIAWFDMIKPPFLFLLHSQWFHFSL